MKRIRSFFSRIKRYTANAAKLGKKAEKNPTEELLVLRRQNRRYRSEILKLQKRLNSLQNRIEKKGGYFLENKGKVSVDDFYYAFEESFRGSRDLVKNRLQMYIPFVERAIEQTSRKDFLDMGCGRAELLEILKDKGIPARGIDSNIRMIKEAVEKGFTVEQTDVLEYMLNLPDNSLSGVSGFHIVEHLPFENLLELLAEIYRVIAPGGVLILETPNPENFNVVTFNFYVDPTHIRPLPPPALNFMVEHTGFKKLECIRVSIPTHHDLSAEGPLPGAVKILNGRLSVGEDYAIIAFKE